MSYHMFAAALSQLRDCWSTGRMGNAHLFAYLYIFLYIHI